MELVPSIMATLGFFLCLAWLILLGIPVYVYSAKLFEKNTSQAEMTIHAFLVFYTSTFATCSIGLYVRWLNVHWNIYSSTPWLFLVCTEIILCIAYGAVAYVVYKKQLGSQKRAHKDSTGAQYEIKSAGKAGTRSVARYNHDTGKVEVEITKPQQKEEVTVKDNNIPKPVPRAPQGEISTAQEKIPPTQAPAINKGMRIVGNEDVSSATNTNPSMQASGYNPEKEPEMTNDELLDRAEKLAQRFRPSPTG